MARKKVLILTTSVFTDRIFQHSTFLQEFTKDCNVEIWAQSYISNSADWNIEGVSVKAFPKVKELYHGLNLLRRANEFAWMYKLPAKSLKINLKHSRDPNHLLFMKVCNRLLLNLGKK